MLNKPSKRLCPGCSHKRSDKLFPKGHRFCELCKIAKRVETKKKNATTNQLDSIVRKICRLEWGDMPTCVCCGLTSGYSNPHTNPHGIQIGHYIKRKKFILRWDIKNLWPQCSHCNVVHNENTLPFTQYILKTVGKDRLDYFEEKLKEYSGSKWLTQNRKNDIMLELEAHLSRLV